jgi:ElaA protein
MKNLIWHYKKFEDLNSAELYEILRLRTEVFVVEQNCVYQECDGKDKKSKHLWLEIEGKIATYCRIVPPGISYSEPSIGRVVTHPKFRNLKLGNQLMKYAIQISENHFETKTIRISAQSYLKNFYENLGFQQVSEEYLEDKIPHIEMLRKL